MSSIQIVVKGIIVQNKCREVISSFDKTAQKEQPEYYFFLACFFNQI
jgi:hypothetical protein